MYKQPEQGKLQCLMKTCNYLKTQAVKLQLQTLNYHNCFSLENTFPFPILIIESKIVNPK